MANITFKHSSSGYVDVMNLAGIQNILKKKAESVKSSANASLSVGGYTAIDDFETAKGHYRDGRGVQNVYTHSLHAMRSQNKHKTLTNALGSSNGGS
jgi:hypothetical protein